MPATFNRRQFLRASAALPLGVYATGIHKALAIDSKNTRSAWMHHNLETLGKRTLRQICIPGAHDAGMSLLDRFTSGTQECNTVTQSHSILGQLQLGARYFDIRPVISADQFKTGHYSNVAGVWHGGNGQSIKSIIQDVNDYTAVHSELIILRLSHDLNTDVGRTSYRPLNQREWDSLFELFNKSLNHLYAPPGYPKKESDITKFKLEEFIVDSEKSQPAVIIIVDADLVDANSKKVIQLPQKNTGFYLPANFNVYDEYTGTYDFDTMKNDQLAKMKQQRPTENSPYFLLSWTLSQNVFQVATCNTGISASIKELANYANARLQEFVDKECTPLTYPNIIYIDNIRSDIGIIDTVMKINKKYQAKSQKLSSK